MVRPQQAADSHGATEPAQPPLGVPVAAANGECRLHGPSAEVAQGQPPPQALFTTVAPPPQAADSASRYTPSPHSQGSASPPQGGATSPHVVLLHIVDGESIQFQRGDNVELIQGPATVQMVSTSASPPMAYPVQVPPGHMMQQVVDGMGTLRHVILSQEPPGMAHVPPYSSSQPPPPYYPAPPPPPAGAPQGYVPQYPPQMYTTGPTAGTQLPPQGPSPPPSHHAYAKDQRSQRRVQRLRRKLSERQRQLAAGGRTSPLESAPTGDEKAGGGVQPAASEPEENGEPGGGSGSGSSICSQQDEEERQTADFLSTLRPPQVSEVTPESALVSWAHPEVTVEHLSIPPDQLSYQLSLAEARPSGPPPAAAYRVVFTDRAVSTQLTGLRPGTAYSIILQGSLGEVQGSPCSPVNFSTQATAPSRPLPPQLQNRTKTSLHLRWSAPHDNGARVSQYILECDAGQGFSEVFRGRTKQHNVTHLTAATTYRVRLSALNDIGQSAFSEPVSLQTSGTVPPPPAPPQLDAAAATSLSLSWQRRPSDHSFALHMEEEHSKYGFLALYSGPDTFHRAVDLHRNTGYSFKLRAVNEEGASRWSDTVSYRTSCQPPQPPSKPTVRGRVHAQHVRLRWEPPRDTGGGVVTGYTLELDRGSGMQAIYSGPEQERTVDTLDPGTTYQLQVRCETEGGVSEPSDPATVTTEPVCPGRCAPPRLHGKPRANTCHVRWGQPEYSGGALASLVTRYELELTLPDASAQSVYSGSDTDCTLGSLLPGRSYQLKVRAVNRVGAGGWSEPLQFVSGAGAPDPPAPPQVSAKSPHQLLVRWMEPANNGAAVSEYRLECSAGGSAPFSVIYTGAGRQHEARGLLPATVYRYRVSAANTAGTSAASEPAVAATLAASPAAVGQVEVEATATSLHVSWRAPPAHGAEILHYTVEVADRLYSTDGPDTQLTVSPLTPDTTYRVRVQAVNSVGAGGFSSVVRETTLSLPPPPPHLQLTHSSHNFVRLRWGDAKQQTDRIVYTLECEAKNGEFYVVYEGSGTQFKVARLAEDTEYRLRICAANEAGDGAYSPVLSVRTTLPPAPTVRGLRVSERSERACLLEWLPAKLAAPQLQDGASYQLQLQRLSAPRDADFRTVYSGAEQQFRALGLEPQQEYQARVCCTASGLQGPFTAPQRFTTPAAPPAAAAPKVSAHHTQKAAEKQPWTEQQWAVAILGAFGALALVLAVLVQQAMVLLS